MGLYLKCDDSSETLLNICSSPGLPSEAEPKESDQDDSRKYSDEEESEEKILNRAGVEESVGEMKQELRKVKQEKESIAAELKKSEDEKNHLEQELKSVKQRNKEVTQEREDIKNTAEQRKLKLNKVSKVLEELKVKIECPVCLGVPREGPVPCCPSGHITCSPCLERLRLQARPGRVKCPTCRAPMGEGRSVLARIVLENMEHQCSGVNFCKNKSGQPFKFTISYFIMIKFIAPLGR